MKQLGNVKHAITYNNNRILLYRGWCYFDTLICADYYYYFLFCSALDAESERVVQDALDKVTKGKREVWVKRRELTL